jgi:hypothetical protein
VGYTNAHVIELGAKHLLSILAQESPIRYSRFYDGSEETSRKLEEAIGLEPACRGWYSVEHIMDLAVYELSEQGIVQTKSLNEKLVDAEPDYEIFLTPQGKQAHLQKDKLQFWDAE